MGQIVGLWRYPVKSMQGEEVASIDVGPLGIVGDRRFGVVDAATGRVLSAKVEPRLLDASARTDGDDVIVTLPDHEPFGALDLGATERARVFSAWLGRDVRLDEVGSDTATSFEMTLDPPNDDAELFDIPAPPGTFLDLAAVHIITTSSFAALAAARPEFAWERRRYRPNVLVDGEADGFAEDDWVGGHVAVGAARLDVLMRTMRCALPLRAQPAFAGDGPLPRSPELFAALRDVHQNDLGVYCAVVTPGGAAVGDPVTAHPAATGADADG